MILADGSEIIPVHFVYKDDEDGGLQKVACIPGFEFQPGQAFPWHRSDDPRSVSCPLCKATQVYVSSSARQAVHWRRGLSS